MGYVKGYKLRSGSKILHVSHSKVKLCLNVENSAMPFTTQEKARILSEYHGTRSVALAPRCILRVLQKSPPYRTDILRWEQKFMESGNVDHRGGNGRPSTSEGTIEQVRQLFQDNSSLSIRAASAQLGIPRSTVHRILHECLFLFPYKLQNLQDISEADKEKRLKFAQHCSSHSDGYSQHLSRIDFPMNACFESMVS